MGGTRAEWQEGWKAKGETRPKQVVSIKAAHSQCVAITLAYKGQLDQRSFFKGIFYIFTYLLLFISIFIYLLLFIYNYSFIYIYILYIFLRIINTNLIIKYFLYVSFIILYHISLIYPFFLKYFI